MHKSREHARIQEGRGEVRCKSCSRGMYSAIEGRGEEEGGELSPFITATVTRGPRRETLAPNHCGLGVKRKEN